MSCNTAEVATCFADASDGDELELSAGTLSSWDGIESDFQLTLQSKYATITCSADGGACIWQGATGKGVVGITNNGGTSTLSHLVVKDGNTSYEGGGLYVQNSNVVLILVAFIDNTASYYGGAIYVGDSGPSTVTLQGCSFSGNTCPFAETTSGTSGQDVFNWFQTVMIYGCPAGEDKPIRPSPPFVPSPTNPPPPPPLFAGFAQTQGSALSNWNNNYDGHSGTMTSPAYSYTCDMVEGKDCPEGLTSKKGANGAKSCVDDPSSSSSVLPILGRVAGALALLVAGCTI